MKNLHFLLFTALVVLSSCQKDDDPVASIDQLPPATQTGAGTFGCLVNGKPFIDNSGSFNCFYQFVDGGYYFHVAGNDEIEFLKEITLATNKKEIADDETYTLLTNELGNVFGAGYFNNDPTSSGEGVTTDQEYSGTLTISNLDFENHIVSGTFSFDLVDPYTQKIIEIRQGRFDTFFTQ